MGDVEEFDALQPIILLGGGRHCKVVLDLILQIGEYTVTGISDIPEKMGSLVIDGFHINVMDKSLTLKPGEICYAFVTHGENLGVRKRLYEQAESREYIFPVLKSPHAYISPYSSIGKGTLIVQKSSVNPSTVIGVNVIINTSSIVEHDCVIGDHSHLGPGAVLCGGVNVGHSTFIGASSVVNPNVTIGDNVLIGSGTVVIKDVPDNVVVVGNPGQIIRDNV